MIRVHVICEGQTEEMFVNRMLAPHFGFRNVDLKPALIGKPGHKGGRVNIDRLSKDISNRLLRDSSCFCTTFFDYYGLPIDFPGLNHSRSLNAIREKANCVKQEMTTQLEKRISQLALRRFIPYVQMYEYEALLFSDTSNFASAINRPNLLRFLDGIRSAFETPEHINDGPLTAPSKRILLHFSGYEKVIHGTIAAESIGLDKIIAECPLFEGWVSELLALSPNS